MAVTDAQVKAIIDTTRDTSAFITNAQVFATEELTGKGLTNARLDLVVLYLSAHFVCLTEEMGGIRRSRMGEADESYKTPGEKDTGLKSTRYGQMAMLLDTSGTLAALASSNGLKALFALVGTPQDLAYE